jgi:hypothetical protein
MSMHPATAEGNPSTLQRRAAQLHAAGLITADASGDIVVGLTDWAPLPP